MPETLLLHVCCAHCAAYPVRHWRERGFEVTAFWYNPNVQPYAEHQSRLEAVRRLCEEMTLPLLVAPGYAFTEHLGAVAGHVATRCPICYRLRLKRTAAEAGGRDYSYFSTTLLISHQQSREEIAVTGEALSAEDGPAFLGEDLRKHYSESRRLTKPLGLYRQEYCGCVYSEYERRTATTLIG